MLGLLWPEKYMDAIKLPVVVALFKHPTSFTVNTVLLFRLNSSSNFRTKRQDPGLKDLLIDYRNVSETCFGIL